jgi:hypothetical protein
VTPLGAGTDWLDQRVPFQRSKSGNVVVAAFV